MYACQLDVDVKSNRTHTKQTKGLKHRDEELKALRRDNAALRQRLEELRTCRRIGSGGLGCWPHIRCRRAVSVTECIVVANRTNKKQGAQSWDVAP